MAATKEEINDRIQNDFKFHPADEAKGQTHQAVREACELAAHKINSLVPESREKSLALTKLEEAMFWANAGIARTG